MLDLTKIDSEGKNNLALLNLRLAFSFNLSYSTQISCDKVALDTLSELGFTLFL